VIAPAMTAVAGCHRKPMADIALGLKKAAHKHKAGRTHATGKKNRIQANA
jgi:hypothetical protein